jgi:hypothetical protein
MGLVSFTVTWKTLGCEGEGWVVSFVFVLGKGGGIEVEGLV